MTVYIGIMCEKCDRVFLVTKTSRIRRYDSSFDESWYELTCVSPCRSVTRFTRGHLRVYSVAGPSSVRGYAVRGEYRELSQGVLG